jgi:hypothetical protein
LNFRCFSTASTAVISCPVAVPHPQSPHEKAERCSRHCSLSPLSPVTGNRFQANRSAGLVSVPVYPYAEDLSGSREGTLLLRDRDTRIVFQCRHSATFDLSTMNTEDSAFPAIVSADEHPMLSPGHYPK